MLSEEQKKRIREMREREALRKDRAAYAGELLEQLFNKGYTVKEVREILKVMGQKLEESINEAMI